MGLSLHVSTNDASDDAVDDAIILSFSFELDTQKNRKLQKIVKLFLA